MRHVLKDFFEFLFSFFIFRFCKQQMNNWNNLANGWTKKDDNSVHVWELLIKKILRNSFLSFVDDILPLSFLFRLVQNSFIKILCQIYLPYIHLMLFFSIDNKINVGFDFQLYDIHWNRFSFEKKKPQRKDYEHEYTERKTQSFKYTLRWKKKYKLNVVSVFSVNKLLSFRWNTVWLWHVRREKALRAHKATSPLLNETWNM